MIKGWIKATPELLENEDWASFHYRYTDGTKLDTDLFEPVFPHGLKKKNGTGFLPIAQVEWLDESPADGDWISVKDGLPKVGQYVQCYLSERGFSPSPFVISKYTIYGFESASNVTYWKPLTAPEGV